MNVNIRSLCDADLDTLLEIAVAAWTPIFESFRQILEPNLFEIVFPQWEMEKKRQIEAACRGEHGVNVYVAELDGKVVGFITYRLDQRIRIGEISNNAVYPQNQGSGIGTVMYKHVLAKMKEGGMKCAKVCTGGDPSHAPARRAYEKVGFSRALPSVDYYQEL